MSRLTAVATDVHTVVAELVLVFQVRMPVLQSLLLIVSLDFACQRYIHSLWPILLVTWICIWICCVLWLWIDWCIYLFWGLSRGISDCTSPFGLIWIRCRRWFVGRAAIAYASDPNLGFGWQRRDVDCIGLGMLRHWKHILVSRLLRWNLKCLTLTQSAFLWRHTRTIRRCNTFEVYSKW